MVPENWGYTCRRIRLKAHLPSFTKAIENYTGWFSANLTQAKVTWEEGTSKVTWEEGTSTEKMFPSAWSVGKSVETVS